MNSGEQESWQTLLRGLRAGDSLAQRQFWERYAPLLERLAERHLAAGLRRRVGADDVVQSACRTFLRRARDGQFELDEDQSLWRLLCAITLTKLREQARFHLRGKRGVQREMHVDSLAARPDQSGAAAIDFAAQTPSPADAVAFADELQRLIQSLDDEERRIVELKLAEYTHDEIAAQLGCSERTVRRLLKKVQTRLAQQWEIE